MKIKKAEIFFQLIFVISCFSAAFKMGTSIDVPVSRGVLVGAVVASFLGFYFIKYRKALLESSRFPVVWLFCISLFIPFFLMIFDIGVSSKSTENRTLAKFPLLPKTEDSLKAFPSNFENAVKDHFPFRNNMTFAFSEFMIRSFGYSNDMNVLLGRNNWLFYSKWPEYKGWIKYKKTDMELVGAYFKETQKHLNDCGIIFLFVLCPNKEEIYPENLPSDIRRGDEIKGDQFINALVSSGVNVLDLRSDLLAAKKTGQLYYSNDTHWNMIGAYYGYRSIMKKLGLKYLDRSSLEYEVRPNTFLGDISRMGGLTSFKDDDILIKNSKDVTKKISQFNLEFKNKGSLNKKKLLSIRDSFSTALVPYYSESFSYARMLWPILEKQSLLIDYKEVDDVKPDYVIYQVLQRQLDVVVNALKKRCPQ